MRAACVVRPSDFASSSPARRRRAAARFSRTLRTVRVSVPPPVSTSASAAAASVPSAVSRAPPTPTQAHLLAFVRRTAADAELIASLPLDPEGRTWVRLEGPGGSEAWLIGWPPGHGTGGHREGPGGSEAWLIGWPPGTGTGWHDHAESAGAFVTAAGELKENALAA